jgi:uncharacterized protein
VTLADTGPLVALLDAGEEPHEACKEALGELRLPLLTTWPVLTEVMFLLGRAGGWVAQRAVWSLIARDDLQVVPLSPHATQRTAELMEAYADTPMSLADATLVALAEERQLNRIFTLDTDFHVYRLRGGQAFEVVPA